MNPLHDDVVLKVLAFKTACFLKEMSARDYAGTVGTNPQKLSRALRSRAPSPLQNDILRFSCETLKGFWQPEALIKARLAVDNSSEVREVDKLRLRLHTYVAENPGASFRKIAFRIGCTHSSITRWLSGNYKHNPANITAKIRRFLEAQGVQTQESAVSK